MSSRHTPGGSTRRALPPQPGERLHRKPQGNRKCKESESERGRAHRSGATTPRAPRCITCVPLQSGSGRGRTSHTRRRVSLAVDACPGHLFHKVFFDARLRVSLLLFYLSRFLSPRCTFECYVRAVRESKVCCNRGFLFIELSEVL